VTTLIVSAWPQDWQHTICLLDAETACNAKPSPCCGHTNEAVKLGDLGIQIRLAVEFDQHSTKQGSTHCTYGFMRDAAQVHLLRYSVPEGPCDAETISSIGEGRCWI